MAVDTLQVTFEASDSAIKFAVDPSLYGDEDEPWTIQFYESGDQSGGGPGLITTNTTTERTTLLENSLAIIDFYGSSCKVIGWGYGFNATVTLDKKPFEFKLPEVTPQGVLFEVEDLDIGYHSFVFNTSHYIEEGELARTSISRVEIDTGLSGMVPRISYSADSDVWDKSGEWQIRTIDSAGSLRSIRSRVRNDYLQISGGLNGPGVVFLYGNAGEDHGVMLISVHNRTTSGEVNPSVFLTSAASAGVTDSLLYYAVIPPEGWKEFSIQNVDIRGRFTEITRLDVYGFETNGEPGLSSSTNPATSTAGPQQPSSDAHSHDSGPPAAVIGGAVAAAVCLIAVAVALFLFLRRRRQHGSHSRPPFNSDEAGSVQQLSPVDFAQPFSIDPPNPGSPPPMHETRLAFGGPATRDRKRPHVLAAPDPIATVSTGSYNGDSTTASRTPVHEWAASSAPPDSTDAGSVTSVSATHTLVAIRRSALVAHAIVETAASGGEGTLPPAYSERPVAAAERLRVLPRTPE